MCIPVSGTLNSLIEKLQSPSSEERECTCTIIAGLVEQEGSVRQLLHHQLVRVMGPLLLDPSWTLRRAAVGALRNVSVEGGSAACEQMVKQDVMTPLVALLQKYECDWRPVTGSKPDLQTEVFDQALHLLWNLCELSVDVAGQIFMQQGLAVRLLSCISPDTHTYSIALAAAQCLYAVSECNSELQSLLSDVEVRAPLETILSGRHTNAQQMLLRALAAGILYNTRPASSAEFHNALISVLSSVLDHETSGLLIAADALYTSVMSNTSPLDADCAMSEAASADTHAGCHGDDKMQKCPLGEQREHELKHTALDQQLEEAGHVISAQQVAVQIIANLCCHDDGDEEMWEDSSDTSHEDVTAADDTEPTSQADWSTLCVPGEIHGAFLSHGVVGKVTSKVVLPDTAVCDRLAEQRKTTALMHSYGELLRCSLLCLGNLVSGLQLEELGGATQLHALWDRLAAMATRHTGNDEMMEAVTGLMHATVLKLAHANSPKLGEVSESDMEFVYKLSSSSKSPEVRAGCVRIVSAIGQAVARQAHPVHAMMKPIGLYLCGVLRGETSLWVVAEAVDAVMDVYAEDHLNPVLVDTQLITTLSSMLPQLKLKVKQQKRSLGEHLPVVMTAKDNLARFIHYKTRLINT